MSKLIKIFTVCKLKEFFFFKKKKKKKKKKKRKTHDKTPLTFWHVDKLCQIIISIMV